MRWRAAEIQSGYNRRILLRDIEITGPKGLLYSQPRIRHRRIQKEVLKWFILNLRALCSKRSQEFREQYLTRL